MLTKSEIEFIKSNINSDINKLAFNKSIHPKNIRSEIVLHQIKILNKITSKLPFLGNNWSFLFPKNISVEQASSEATANYKTTIVDYEIITPQKFQFDNQKSNRCYGQSKHFIKRRA